MTLGLIDPARTRRPTPNTAGMHIALGAVIHVVTMIATAGLMSTLFAKAANPIQTTDRCLTDAQLSMIVLRSLVFWTI